MRYRNAKEAIDWLCRTFGFERHLVVEGDGEEIAHAQLAFDGGMGSTSIGPSPAHARGVGSMQPG